MISTKYIFKKIKSDKEKLWINAENKKGKLKKENDELKIQINSLDDKKKIIINLLFLIKKIKKILTIINWIKILQVY